MSDNNEARQGAQASDGVAATQTTHGAASAAPGVDRKAVADLPALEDLRIKPLAKELINEEQEAQATALFEGQDWLDPMKISRQGEKDTAMVSVAARNLLDSTRIADAGEIGQTLLAFQMKLREIGMGDMEDSGFTKFVRKFIPGASAAEKWYRRLQDMGPELQKILANADKEGLTINESWLTAKQVAADCDRINERIKIWIRTTEKGVAKLEALVAELEAKKKALNDPEINQKYDDAVTARETAQRKLADWWQTRAIVLKARGELALEQKGLLFQGAMLRSSLKLYEVMFYTQGTAALIAQKMQHTNELLQSMREFGKELVSQGSHGLQTAMDSLLEMRKSGTIDPEALKQGVDSFLSLLDKEQDNIPAVNESLKNLQAASRELVERLEARTVSGGVRKS